MEKNWDLKNIIFGATIVSVVILSFLLYLKTNDLSSEKKFDSSFEMIDPKNPESTADEIIRLRRDYNNDKNERSTIDDILSICDSVDNFGLNNLKKNIPKVFYTQQSNFDSYYSKPLSKTDQKLLYLTTDAKEFLSLLDPNNIFSFYLDKLNSSNYEFKGSNDGYIINDFSNSQTSVICNSFYKRYKSKFISLLSEVYPSESSLSRTYRSGILQWEGFQYNDPMSIEKNKTVHEPDSKALLRYIEGTTEQLSVFITTLKNRRDTLNKSLVKQWDTYSKKVDDYRSSRLDINDKAIKYGIVAFCVTALTMYIAGLVYRNKLRRSDTPDGESRYREEFRVSAWYSVYMITVLLLIITIFILGLAKLLTENSLAALLGGIAGYVLNNKMDNNNQAQKNISETTTSTLIEKNKPV
jgi:hypothetical protein